MYEKVGTTYKNDKNVSILAQQVFLSLLLPQIVVAKMDADHFRVVPKRFELIINSILNITLLLRFKVLLAFAPFHFLQDANFSFQIRCHGLPDSQVVSQGEQER